MKMKNHFGNAKFLGALVLGALILAGVSSCKTETEERLVEKKYAQAVVFSTESADGVVTVTMTSATEDAVIRYTTDGTEPTEESMEYTMPVQFTKTTQIAAIAIAKGMENSPVSYAEVSINEKTGDATIVEKVYAEAVKFSSTLNEDGSVAVTMTSATQGAEIRYTKDGSEPFSKSIKYDGPVNFTEDAELAAIAIAEGMENSPISYAKVSINEKKVVEEGEKKDGKYLLPFSNVSEFKGEARGYNKVILTWTNPNDENFKEVVLSAVPAEGSLSKPVTLTDSYYTVTSLSSGTDYQFTLFAYDKDGKKSTGSSINVKTAEATVTKLELVSEPAKKEYYVDEDLDVSDLKVKASYNDGKTAVISDYDYEPKTVKSAGNHKITVSYGGKTAFFEVSAKVDFLKMLSLKAPTKDEYRLNESVDFSGAVVKAVYDSGKTVTLSEKEYDYSPKALTSTGTQKITISYQTQTAEFEVTVSSVSLSSLAIKTPAAKTSYNLGDKVSTAGLVLEATYSDSTTKEITNYTVSPEELSSAGTQVIILTYGDKTATYEVSVANTLSFAFRVNIDSLDDPDDLLSFDEESCTFIAKDCYEKYFWYIDGIKTAIATNGFCKVFDTFEKLQKNLFVSLDEPNHSIMVVVYDKNGDYYSATAEFTVSKSE